MSENSSENDAQDPSHDDLDALLEPLIGLATEALGEHGEFYPAAAALTTDGEVTILDIEPESEDPEPEEFVGQLASRLSEMASAGEIRASGIAVNVQIDQEDGEPTDAILVNLEHQDMDPVDVALPYELHGDHIHTGELMAAPGERRVFTETS
jgi:hypothetical protein